MQAASEQSASQGLPRQWLRRLFGRWWRRQSPARQDRFATLGPLISVLMFLAAIVSAFWYLRNEEFEREQALVRRDTEIAQQQIRLRLIENQEQLVRIARELVTRAIDQQEFLNAAASFARERPEITQLVWVNAAGVRQASYSLSSMPVEIGPPDVRNTTRPSEPGAAFVLARDLRNPVYSRAFPDPDRRGNVLFQIHVPMTDRSTFAGALIAEYSVEGLIRYFVPVEVARRHAISVLDTDEQSERVIASTITPRPAPAAARRRSSTAVAARPAAA